VVAEATSSTRAVDNPMILREQALGELERLFAALARSRRVVVFLDDLQWADRDSLALLARALRLDAPIPCLFVTTARTGAELPAGAGELLAGATRIALGGLTPSESRVLCAELREADGAGPAADDDSLVREAGGHPLFLAELVRSARRGQRHETARLEEVVWQRIAERDPLERRFLEVLAIGGAPIPYDIVARAAGVDPGECQTHLGSLRAAQLIRVSRRGDDRLVVPYHDRIRESILLHRQAQTVTEDHLRLGRALYDGTPKAALNAARVFAIVRHFNAARDLVVDRAERVRVAELNLTAAREAVMATAYDAAQVYAQTGCVLLGDAGWDDAYAVMRDLHIERMRAEYLVGQPDRARASFEAASARVTSPAERTDLYVTWIELESNRGDYDAALGAGRERLGELGISLPRRAGKLSVLAQYLLTRRAQAGRTPEELADLGASNDPQRDGAMKVLMAITPAAYWKSSDLVGWVSLRLARLSMRYGLSDVSSYGFASYGVILAGAFRRCVEAEALGRLALALNERFRNEKLAAKLLLLNGQFLRPWVRPFAEAVRLLRESHACAVKQGDTTYETLAACCTSHLTALASADLAEHRRLGLWAREVCARRKDWNMVGSVEGHLRFSEALAGARTLDYARRSPEPEFLALAGDRAAAPSAHGAYWVFGAWAAYLFGEIEAAAAWIAQQRDLAQGHFGHAAMADLCFLECLVAARQHDGASWPRRLVLRWSMARRVRALRGWARDCPDNFEAHYLIACAELARVRGDGPGASEGLERAAESARTHGSLLREGLALELASGLAARTGDAARADRLRDQAVDAYERCGATAKAAALRGRA
jgi:predicted ATPase